MFGLSGLFLGLGLGVAMAAPVALLPPATARPPWLSTKPGPEPLDPAVLVDPLPEPDHFVANMLILTGGLMVVGGLAGLLASPGCATRDAASRCVDARGAHPAFPALVVVGLGATITGAFWRRQDLPD